MGRQHVHAAITAGLAITLVTSGVPTAAIAQTLGIEATPADEVERTDAGEEQGDEVGQSSFGQEGTSLPLVGSQPSAPSTPENENLPISGGSAAAAPELGAPAQQNDASASGVMVLHPMRIHLRPSPMAGPTPTPFRALIRSICRHRPVQGSRRRTSSTSRPKCGSIVGSIRARRSMRPCLRMCASDTTMEDAKACL